MSTYDRREITGGQIFGGWPKRLIGWMKEEGEVLNEEGQKLRQEFEEMFGRKAVRKADAAPMETAPTPGVQATAETAAPTAAGTQGAGAPAADPSVSALNSALGTGNI